MIIETDDILWMALITLAIVGVWNAILSYKMWKAWNLKESGTMGKEEPATFVETKVEAAPAPVEPAAQAQSEPVAPTEPEPEAPAEPETPPAPPAEEVIEPEEPPAPEETEPEARAPEELESEDPEPPVPDEPEPPAPEKLEPEETEPAEPAAPEEKKSEIEIDLVQQE